jgi:hypothetical protein
MYLCAHMSFRSIAGQKLGKIPYFYTLHFLLLRFGDRYGSCAPFSLDKSTPDLNGLELALLDWSCFAPTYVVCHDMSSNASKTEEQKIKGGP